MPTETVFDPRLQDDIPAWVIENIQAVSAYMKTRGHDDWQIAGIYSAAAHAREVGELGKDARRYRWLVPHFRCDPDVGGNHSWWSCTPRPLPRGQTLDAAIDAAMGEPVREVLR